MPKAISKRDMLRLHIYNRHEGLQYTLPSKDYHAMPDGSYAMVFQHVLVDDVIVRCIVRVPTASFGAVERKIDFAVEDFNRLPEAEDVLKEMEKP